MLRFIIAFIMHVAVDVVKIFKEDTNIYLRTLFEYFKEIIGVVEYCEENNNNGRNCESHVN